MLLLAAISIRQCANHLGYAIGGSWSMAARPAHIHAAIVQLLELLEGAGLFSICVCDRAAVAGVQVVAAPLATFATVRPLVRRRSGHVRWWRYTGNAVDGIHCMQCVLIFIGIADWILSTILLSVASWKRVEATNSISAVMESSMGSEEM